MNRRVAGGLNHRDTEGAERRLIVTQSGAFPEKELTRQIIGAAMEVHRELGAGLLESAYRACVARELALRGIPFELEKAIPVQYKGVEVDIGYRVDIVVDDKVVVELKAVERIRRVHEAQMLTYLKLTGCRVGLLINFNVALLKQGIKRLVL